MDNEIEIAEAPVAFRPVHPREFQVLSDSAKLNELYALAYHDHQRLNGALGIIEQVGRDVGPILESMQSNPMFKMMGFGKKL